MVEADQIKPTKAIPVTDPRAWMISSMFWPNSWPRAGAINSSFCMISRWSIDEPRLKLAMEMLSKARGNSENRAK